MIFNIKQSNLIRGGTLTVDLTPIDDIYQVDWSADIKLGKKIFGKWVSLPGFSKSGSERIPKELFSEEFIKNNSEFDIKGKHFYKQSDEHITTGYVDGDMISFFIRLDGNDPVEITLIDIVWSGYTICAVLE